MTASWLMMLSGTFLAALAGQTEKPAPEQPLPFSHKAHAGGMKLKCKMCHLNPEPGEAMGIAPASVCMSCHSAVKADSPAIRKLADFARNNLAIPWVRVYEIPSYASFSHKTHLSGGNDCEDCHGRVADRERLTRERDISMGGCMNCHQSRKVSIDCTFCHDPR
ncbi:MAG TPA: cytochrome c3 family protein [Bryobacteraceae bacterium]|nr:cytochrome c3 family protein [Bryobacteraceae bacterium]